MRPESSPVSWANFGLGWPRTMTNDFRISGFLAKKTNGRSARSPPEMIVPDQLVELAEAEINAPVPGAPRQTVLCRAVSSAYYALFHRLSALTSGTFVPASAPKARAMFYRALDHRRTYERCRKLGQNPLPRDEKNFFGIDGFCSELCDFANEFVRLQELRHSADYDGDFKISKALAQEAVDSARQAISKLEAANDGERVLFLAYLLFGLRA